MFYTDSPPPNENILATIERGVRGAEGIIGAPFPLTDLIVLSANVEEYDIGYGGVNWVDSLVLLREKGLSLGESILYHEIAHFYLTAEIGPSWLYEGGANFVAEYIKAQHERNGELRLNEHALQYCRDQEVPNLHALNDPDHPHPVGQQTCGYSLGLYFLTSLFNTIGEAAFSSAVRELYELYLDYEYYATDEQVYRIFLKHTPADREEAFLNVYRRLHGGPFLDES